MIELPKFRISNYIYLVSDSTSKKPAGAASIHAPGVDLLRVGPHEVAEGPFVGDFDATLDGVDLVEGADVRRKACVDTENVAVHHGRDPQTVEHLRAVLPRVRVPVLSDYFVVEAVDLDVRE